MYDKVSIKVRIFEIFIGLYIIRNNIISRSISEVWFKNKNQDEDENFIVDSQDNTAYDEPSLDMNSENINHDLEQEIHGEDNDDDDLEDYFAPNNPVSKFQPTMLQNDIICAPGEGNFPKSVLFDDAAEEITFLKIYGGKRTNYPKDLSYAACCKSEIRRYDRRCALNITKIFYSYKKLVASKLIQAINTSLTKTNQTMGLTAREALCDEKMNDFFASNEARLFLRTIRSSPQFWEWKKSEINAMIRQLGCPTFFITFSPAEIDWLELIVILFKVVYNRKITIDQAKKISRSEKIDIVSKDPVTVSRYFENRIMELLKYTNSPAGPFRNHMISDYFWRDDFQNRGSPHVHMLTWHNNAPKYLTNFETKQEYIDNTRLCCEFIDKYITCERPNDDSNCVICDYDEEINNDLQLDELNISNDNSNSSYTSSQKARNANKLKFQVNLKYQEHAHKTNCRIIKENGEEMCKYNFPKPILDETIILKPLKDDDDYDLPTKEEAFELYIKIRKQLKKVHDDYKKYNILVDLDLFLKDLSITYEQYILALRTSIISPTVFLKRSCRELMLNQYNKKLIVRHRANMDIQFVTDPYGAAQYVAAYMLKSNAAMSTLLKKAMEEMKNGNLSIRQKLNKLANKFQIYLVKTMTMILMMTYTKKY